VTPREGSHLKPIRF